MPHITYDTGPDVRIVINSCHGDLLIEGGDRTLVELSGEHNVARRVTQTPGELTITGSHGDLTIRVGTGVSVVAHRVSGDVSVSDIASIELKSVGGDLTARSVSSFQAGDVGGDLRVELIDGPAHVSRVGGDAHIRSATTLNVGVVGGDAALENVGQLEALGQVGGDLQLQWTGALNQELSVLVGGDAQLELTPEASFNLSAVVGGDISGDGGEPPRAQAPDGEQAETFEHEDFASTEVNGDVHGWELESGGGTLIAKLGEGGAELRLKVGGDFAIHGGRMSDASYTGREKIEINMDDFAGLGEEMRRLGREMKAMGRELAREVAREVRYSTRNIGPGPRPRVHVQVNDKTFHFDEEQIDRLTRQAREAAASGVARAQEAIERALVNMVSVRQRIERPPVAPLAPVPPVAPEAPRAPFVGQTVRIEREAPVAEARSAEEVQAEKLAILRMVSEGRLAIDEAEAMLRALESRG